MTDRERGDRTETLVALRALSAKWREEAARWRSDDETPYACEWADTQDECASDLDAELSSLASRAAQEETPAIAHLATAMKKMLPPALLAEVIAHLDPVTPFVQFLRDYESAAPAEPPSRAAAPQEWRPIETAPKDGTDVLLCEFRNGNMGAIEHGSWGFIETSDWDGKHVYGWMTDMGRIDEPTHWMPAIPAPQERPTPAAEGQE